MGHRIWVVYDVDGIIFNTKEMIVLSIKQFLPADPPGSIPFEDRSVRKKHLIQLWTNPGGCRTLTVGSIRLTKPINEQAPPPLLPFSDSTDQFQDEHEDEDE